MLDSRVGSRIAALFRQGLEPREMAWSVSIGSVVGTFPVFGTTTAMITGISFLRRLNLPIMMSFSYLVTPIQLGMIVPFIRLGKWVFSPQAERYNLKEIKGLFEESWLGAIRQLGVELLYGVFGWCLVAGPAIILLYLFAYKTILIYIKASKRGNEPAPKH